MTDHILDPDEQDVPLEPRLADAARAYNPPPPTPREAMWARIEAARRQAGAAPATPAVVAAPAAPAPEAKVVSIDAARARRSRVRTWVVLAGTLAAGIAIGVVGTRGPGTETVAVTPPPAVDSARRDTGAAPAAPATSTATLPAPSTQVATTTPAPRAEDAPRPLAPPRPIRPENIPPRSAERMPQYAAGTRAEASQLYHAAAVQTLSQAEALLVAWRVDAPRDSASARQVGRWARDVLGSTRLLLDSPAASDARLRALLDDLELVLAQIVQLSGAPLTAEERALLERSVRDRNLIPRIRSAVPAGQPAGATAI